MSRDIKTVLESCKVCGLVAKRKKYQVLKPIEMLYFFKLVLLDTGKITFPTGGEGVFLAAIDHFIQWMKVKVVSQKPL